MRIPSQLHFVGIGGVGMSAVASVWQETFGPVSGSDLQPSPTVRRLLTQGIKVDPGHDEANVERLLRSDGKPLGGVVVSTAVPADNPEVVAARRQGIPIFHRSEVLGALMAEHRSIAVTGTHGKSTTSGMLGTMLLEAGLDPSILVGAEIPGIGSNARKGTGDLLVAEADESDRSLLRLTAQWAIVTNLEADHLEHYRDLEDIIATVATWVNRLPSGAEVVACVDDAGVRTMLPRLERQAFTYGWSPDADFILADEVLGPEGSTFTLAGVPYAIKVPGRHNIANAAACIVTALRIGLQPAAIRAALPAFTGVGRRFEARGTEAGIQVLEDYAHHPSEIRATLATARLLKRPVWVVFQPHRYTRTKALFAEFAGAFEGAAGVGLMDVYAAGEEPNGVNSEMLASEIRRCQPALPVHHWPDARTAVAGLGRVLAPGDVVILMGAGNVNKVAEPLLASLHEREAAIASHSA